MRFSLHWLEFACCMTVLAAAAGSMAGCASNQFVTQSIPDRMKPHADAYRRVGILSLALSSQALTDSSLVLIWPLNHNGLFHLIQVLFCLLRGLNSGFRQIPGDLSFSTF